MKNEQIQIIKMSLIDRPVRTAREIIDPEKIRELAESIRESGLLQPVLLRPQNGRFEMIAGDRRYLAHKLLNLQEIKAIVKELDDKETIIIRAVENLQRVNLTHTEEGQGYLFLKEEGGLTADQIAKKTGKSVNTVKRYINFARCPEEVRRAVDRKEISLGTLETLQEIDDPEAFQYHFKMAAANGITETVARSWVEDFNKTKIGTYYSDGGGQPQQELDLVLKPIYMTCEVCLGACEIKLIRNISVCPDCRKKTKHQ